MEFRVFWMDLAKMQLVLWQCARLYTIFKTIKIS
jgi:hypothetical protein